MKLLFTKLSNIIEIKSLLYQLHYKSHTNSEGGPLTDEAFAISYDRAMRFLGIKYHLQGDSVIIDDLSKLTNELTRYGERNARAA